VDQCEAVAFLGLEPGASAQALAACQDMCALLKQPDEIEHKRTLLKKRIDTLAKALQVSAASSLHSKESFLVLCCGHLLLSVRL